MKILMLHNSYQQRGGEDESFESERRMLTDFGQTVDVIELNNKLVNDIGKMKAGMQTIWSASSYHLVDTALRKRKYDVMHVQNFFPLFSPAVYYAAKKNAVPVVQTLRNYRILCPSGTFFRDGKVCEDCLHDPFKLPGIIHGCYRGSRVATATVAAMSAIHSMVGTWNDNVDLYICLTEFTRSKFIQAGFSEQKLAVKANFVYPDPGIGDGEGGFVLFVGRLSPNKGIATLLSAWERIDKSLQLRIVGDGPMAGIVREACSRLANVEWLGEKSTDFVKDLMGQASALVFPSEWYETFGRVAIESFAKGTPVIASRIGAIAEVVEDGVTGLLFEPGNVTDLASKIEFLLKRGDLLSKMRVDSRSRYESSYTAGGNCQKLLELYQEACVRSHAHG